MKSIIPERSQSTTFDKLIQASMDMFISEGEVFSPLHVKCLALLVWDPIATFHRGVM